MELFSVLALGAIVVTAALAFARHQERARMRSWLDAVRRLHLGDIVERPRRGFSRPRLTCTSEPLNVRLEQYRQGKHETGTRIVIDGLGQGAEPLTLKSEGLGTRLFGREIEIGDPAFDDVAFVQGPAPLALAVLDAPARTRLARLLRGEVEGQQGEWIPVTATLDRGVLEVRVKERYTAELAERVYHVLRGALQSAHQLVAPGDIPTRLVENLEREPLADVRLKLVAVLVREYPDHPEARRAVRAALRDQNGEVRLRAAMALGEEGHEALFDLAEYPEDSYAPRAITALGGRLPTARVKALLDRALTESRPQTAQACIQSLGQRGSEADEGLLLRALDSEDPPAVAVAAARALGQTGTAAAVAPLRAVASSILPNPLRSAARQAIAEIQARLTGAAPGQLSLATGAAGALSLATGEAGELSLADSEPAVTSTFRQAEVEHS